MNNKTISLLYFLVFVCLSLQIMQLTGLSSSFAAADKSAMLNEIRKEIPLLVTEQINSQIQELAMDRISLDRAVKQGTEKALTPTLLKVGTRSLNENEFIERLNDFSKRPENQKLPREDQKNVLIKEIHQQFAITEDAKASKLDTSKALVGETSKIQFQVFFAELLRLEITPPTPQETENWYKDNQSLFAQGDLFSFQSLQAENKEDLLGLSSPEKFLASTLKRDLFEEVSENQIPYAFQKALRALEKNQLSPVLRNESAYHLLLKTKDSSRMYTPLTQVIGSVQEQLTFQKLRQFFSKTANPLQFQSKVEESNEQWKVDGNPLPVELEANLKEILPSSLMRLLGQSSKDKNRFLLEAFLIHAQYQKNPNFFGASLHQEIQKKSRLLIDSALIRAKQASLTSQEITNTELLDFYEKNKARFVQSEGQLVGHIFIREKREALELLNQVLKDAKHFSEVAQSRSQEARTARFGGDMRYLNADDISEEMNRAVATLKEGEVYPQIVPSAKGDGFHLLKYVGKVPSKVLAFEEVEGKLREWLLRERQNKAITSYIDSILKKYPLTVDTGLISRL